MAGNVSEWTSPPLTNSTSASHEIIRIVKGGYFGTVADQLLLWKRFPMLENDIREGIGFRCAKYL